MSSAQSKAKDALILVVDDDKQMRYVLYHMLEKNGYNCLAANNGKDALAFVRANPVDLVIADIIMPGMDGFVLLDRIKKDSDTHVILITAYTGDYPTHEIIEKGADDFIQKPISSGELILRVKRVLKTRAVMAERNRVMAEIEAKETQLRSVVARSSELEEEMRRKFAMELHDRIGQNLTALNINLSLLRNMLPEEYDRKKEGIIEDSLHLVVETADQTRDIMSRLRPVGLDDYGLAGAVSWFARRFSERTGVHVKLEMDSYQKRLPVTDETVLFRITQEAFTNIAKHAGATRVTASMTDGGTRLIYRITDNGKGFDAQKVLKQGSRAGYGIVTMRERLRLRDAIFRIFSEPGEGTSVEVEFFKPDDNGQE